MSDITPPKHPVDDEHSKDDELLMERIRYHLRHQTIIRGRTIKENRPFKLNPQNILSIIPERPILIISILISCSGIAIILMFLYYEIDCRQQNKVPGYPLFPNATQVKESDYRSEVISNQMVARYYQTANLREDVLQFYEENSSCTSPDNWLNIACEGSTAHSGRYFVHIPPTPDPNTGLLEFIIEVQWEGCVTKFEAY